MRANGTTADGVDDPRPKRLYIPLDPSLHRRVTLWAKWSNVHLPTMVGNFLEEQVKGFSVSQRSGASTPFRVAVDDGPTIECEREAV